MPTGERSESAADVRGERISSGEARNLEGRPVFGSILMAQPLIWPKQSRILPSRQARPARPQAERGRRQMQTRLRAGPHLASSNLIEGADSLGREIETVLSWEVHQVGSS